MKWKRSKKTENSASKKGASDGEGESNSSRRSPSQAAGGFCPASSSSCSSTGVAGREGKKGSEAVKAASTAGVSWAAARLLVGECGRSRAASVGQRNSITDKPEDPFYRPYVS